MSEPIVFDKEFEMELSDLTNGEAKLVSGSKNNYLVTREGNLFRVYIQKPKHP